MAQKIILEPYEVLMAAEVGIRRRVASMRRNNYGEWDYFNSANLDAWHVDIEGAIAELAFARSINAYWDGSVNTGKAADVAGYQVRYTHHKNGSLVIRERDPDCDEYVLVIGRHPVYFIHGKIMGGDAKKPEFLRDPHGRNQPAWFVPQEKLIEVRQFLEYGLNEFQKRGFLLNDRDLAYVSPHLEVLELQQQLIIVMGL